MNERGHGENRKESLVKVLSETIRQHGFLDLWSIYVSERAIYPSSLYAQADIIQQRIHPDHIILHRRQRNKHLRQPLEVGRKRHSAKGGQRNPGARVGVLVRILVLVRDAGGAGAFVTDEEDGAAVCVAGFGAVGDEAGETEGCEGEGVFGASG